MISEVEVISSDRLSLLLFTLFHKQFCPKTEFSFVLWLFIFFISKQTMNFYFILDHGLRTPREKIAFTARPKIQSQSQIFRYGDSIFCLPHRPKFPGFFGFCLHWVSVGGTKGKMQKNQYIVLAMLNKPFWSKNWLKFEKGLFSK